MEDFTNSECSPCIPSDAFSGTCDAEQLSSPDWRFPTVACLVWPRMLLKVTDQQRTAVRPLTEEPELPLLALGAFVPSWRPDVERPVALTGGYSHGVYALGDKHVLRFAVPERAERLRHETLTLNDLGARPDLAGIADRLPKVVASFDAGKATDGRCRSKWRGWHGLIINRFPGSNAFRAWLDADDVTRLGWVREAVRILRSVHGFPEGLHSGRGPLLPADRYTCGWYGTRIQVAGTDWRECHRAYLSELGALLAAGVKVGHRNLIEASIAACVSRLDVMTTVWGPRPGHGDFHLHNIIVDGASVTGLIDWEWGGLTEPDADLTHMLRWSLFPAHPADEDLEDLVSAEDFVGVPSAVWSAYPEAASTKGIEDRIFVYLVEHDLHQLSQHPESPQAIIRLEAWLGGAHLGLTPRD